MAFRTTPQLGPGIESVLDPAKSDVWYDIPGRQTLQSPKPGNTEMGSDGKVYVYVRASVAIAAAATPGTQVTITEPAFTAAAGAGGFYAPNSAVAPGGVPSGAYFYARKGTL